MGEKLLAQHMLVLLRATTGRNSPAARAVLDWAGERKEWLWPDRTWSAAKPKKRARRHRTLDWDSLARLAGEIDTGEPKPANIAVAEAAARLLGFEPFDAALLAVAVGMARFRRIAALCQLLAECGTDLVALAGILAGADEAAAAARVRRSAPLAMGLLAPGMAKGAYRLELDWRFSRLLDQGLTEEEALIDALTGTRQKAALGPDDFHEQRNSFDLLVRLLRGATGARAAGVNVLLHGPPGTGKTEFARTLAAAAGAELYAVGEADEDGEEPSRWVRLHALKRGQRLLARRGATLLLFDEMEDLFADASETADGGFRAGSKIFVNQMLETNPVPVIWTSNDIGSVDPAHLRRMSFVLRMDYPGAKARARIVGRIAEEDAANEAASGLDPLLPVERESAAVARVALRSARLAGGGSADAEASARSLLTALRGGRSLPPVQGGGGLDLALYESEADIAGLVGRLTSPGAPADFSLLLTGPPGTGKTALAAHLARRLDRPLAVKRASDLLSKWLGDTEAKIAEAFAEAREQGAVLLFDEADSLLLDRQDAQRSWEITQVNELLTWMDGHPLPFIAATNFARRLDPAALRRFVFKIDLKPMSEAAAERAFQRFFGAEAPAGLGDVSGLTPGDFAVVKRQLRYRPGLAPAELVGLLAAEVAAKPERPMRIGF